MSTFNKKGFVSPTDIKKRFRLTYEVTDDLVYDGTYIVRNENSDHGQFMFILVAWDYQSNKWRAMEAITLKPGEEKSGDFQIPIYYGAGESAGDGPIADNNLRITMR